MRKTLPARIFVRLEDDGSDEPYLIACETEADVVEDGGETKYGVYSLTSAHKAVKVVKRLP